MSLILTLRKGHDFYVEDTRIVVSDIISGVEFILKLPDGRLVAVDDGPMTTILPGVHVQAAIPKNQSCSVIKVAIDAPGKKILRGELYRKDRGKACSTCNGSGKLTQRVQRGSGGDFYTEQFTCPDCI